ncbi:MAG: DUF2147 domain-containing protein [Rhodobacteraceae bacterium]|nr:DUF2147 domain-containing protein [Paracoccaceae bacterium]
MKKLLLGLVLVIFTGMPAFASDPVLGLWQTEVDDDDDARSYAIVNFYMCGSDICGSIARTFDVTGETQSENIGRDLVWGMSANGGGKYSGGKIWQPSTDKEFKSKMVLNGNVLKVSGCVAFICKKQTWNRVQ